MDTSPRNVQDSYGLSPDRGSDVRHGARPYGGRHGGGPIGQAGAAYGGQSYTADHYGGRGGGDQIDIDRIMAAVRRQFLVVALFLALALAAGAGYLYTATEYFTSRTQVLIDSKALEIVNEAAGSAFQADDESFVLSQIEVAQSRVIAEKVIETLRSTDVVTKLPEDSELRYLMDLLNSRQQTESGGDPIEAAAGLLTDSFEAERVGRTSVLDFAFTSEFPTEAALVANAYAQVFIASQLDTKFEASRRAGDWLQTRLEELNRQAQEAEVAVQQFRAKHQLAQSDGRLVSDQQLNQLSSQYVEAQAATAAAEARYNQIRTIIESGDTGALVEEALSNGIINDLRGRYVDASRLMTELLEKVGPEHSQVLRLGREMREYEQLIFAELGRIAQSYLSDLEVARKQQESLEASFGTMLGANEDIGEVLVELRELERNAEVYRNLYEVFVERFEQSAQDQAFPVSEVRIISYARAPTDPSAPQPKLIIALVGILGLGLGIGYAAIREYRDRSIRSGDEVRRDLGLEFLGEVSLVSLRQIEKESGRNRRGRSRAPAESMGPIAIETPLLKYAAEHPMSSFAETMRSVRHATARRRPGGGGARIVGFGSLVPGEGKTTMALNFATLMASTGARVLLVDTDFRNPATSRAIASACGVGLAEAIQSEWDFRRVVYFDQRSALSVIPINVGNPQTHSSELLSDPHFTDSILGLSGEYDFIVLDMPPIGPIVDVRVVAPLLDAMVLVVEWGRLPITVIQSAIDAEPDVFERCAGVILNKVDPRKSKLYAADSARSYLSNEYKKYYRE